MTRALSASALLSLVTAIGVFSSGCVEIRAYREPTAAEDEDELPDDDDAAMDDDDAATDDDDAATDDDDAGEEEQPEECTYLDFPAVMEQAVVDLREPNQPMYVYQARDTDTSPFDEMRMMSFQAAPYNGPSGPGNYSLAGSNYADCSLCLLVLAGCSEDYSCDTTFFADEGNLRIDAMAGPEQPFAATFSGVVFREVSIDSETFESTPVAGGATWCVDGYTTTTTAIGVY